MKINLIHNPTMEEFKPVINLLNKVFSNIPGSSGKYSSTTAFEKTKDKDPVLFNAINNDILVGFAITYERYKNYCHVWQLGVSEKSRKKGIASALYDDIEKLAKQKGYKGVTLNTFNRYLPNIILILKRGYKIYDIDKSNELQKDPKIMFKKNFD